MYKQVLIPTDGSELSNRAVAHGSALAKAVGAKVLLFHVTEPFHIFTTNPDQLEDTRAEHARHAKEHASKVLNAAAEIATTAGVAHEQLSEEHSFLYEAILQIAEARRCDLIVMSSHGPWSERCAGIAFP